MTAVILDFAKATARRPAPDAQVAYNPVAQGVSFRLPENFDILLPPLGAARGEPPVGFAQGLSERCSFVRFMTEHFVFVHQDPERGNVKHTLFYRDVIAAASLTTLERFAHAAQEPWVAYANNLFYTAYGIWLTASGYTDLKKEVNGSTCVVDLLPTRLVHAARFFDYPMQAAAACARTSSALHPLVVVSEAEYQSATMRFEQDSLYVDMAHIYAHQAGLCKVAPDEATWFPQW
jgi:hypothetical protein